LAETEYLLPIWVDTRIRHYHRTERGRIVRFSLQLEVEIEGSWREVIRYDSAHGYAHIDRFNRAGSRRKKRLGLGYGAALTRAERDLRQNWLAYRERFLRGEFP